MQEINKKKKKDEKSEERIQNIYNIFFLIQSNKCVEKGDNRRKLFQASQRISYHNLLYCVVS